MLWDALGCPEIVYDGLDSWIDARDTILARLVARVSAQSDNFAEVMPESCVLSLKYSMMTTARSLLYVLICYCALFQAWR